MGGNREVSPVEVEKFSGTVENTPKNSFICDKKCVRLMRSKCPHCVGCKESEQSSEKRSETKA